MPTESSRSLPEKPDLRHLKDQAKDLVRAGDSPSLAKAQLRLAREFGGTALGAGTAEFGQEEVGVVAEATVAGRLQLNHTFPTAFAD